MDEIVRPGFIKKAPGRKSAAWVTWDFFGFWELVSGSKLLKIGLKFGVLVSLVEMPYLT